MATVTKIKSPDDPDAALLPCEILNWRLLGETDPQRLARAASLGSTLAVLVLHAINLGGDTTGIPDDDLAEDLLVEISRFNAHICDRLAQKLGAREEE